MTKFFSIFSRVLPFLILGAEMAIGAGKGADKRALVIGAIQPAIEALHPPDKVTAVAQAVGEIIDATVTAMHATGDLPAHTQTQ